MAMYLPVVTGLVGHAALAGMVVTAIGAVFAVVAVLILATRYGNPVSQLAFGRSHDPEVILLLLGVLGLALVAAAAE